MGFFCGEEISRSSVGKVVKVNRDTIETEEAFFTIASLRSCSGISKKVDAFLVVYDTKDRKLEVGDLLIPVL